MSCVACSRRGLWHNLTFIVRAMPVVGRSFRIVQRRAKADRLRRRARLLRHRRQGGAVPIGRRRSSLFGSEARRGPKRRNAKPRNGSKNASRPKLGHSGSGTQKGCQRIIGIRAARPSSSPIRNARGWSSGPVRTSNATVGVEAGIDCSLNLRDLVDLDFPCGWPGLPPCPFVPRPVDAPN